MANIVDVLEERLKQYLEEQETKKTWEEWLDLLSNFDCKITFEKPVKIPNRPFNFQTLLAACEEQLIHYPEWQAKFSTPAWLIKQKLDILPNSLGIDENQLPGVAEISALNSELARLIDQVHNVQHRLAHMETISASCNIKVKTNSNS